MEDFSEVNRRARSADRDLSDRQSSFLKSTPVRQKVIRRRRLGFLMMPLRKPKAIVPTQRKVIDPKEVREKTREALSKISPILHGSAPLTNTDMAPSSIVLDQLQEIYRRNGLEMPTMTLKDFNLPSENIAEESPAPGSAPFPDAPAVSTLISNSVVEQNSVAEPGFVQISDAQVTPPTPAESFMEELVGASAQNPSDAATVVEVGLDSRDDPQDDEIDENAGRVTLTDLWNEHSLYFRERNLEQSQVISTWMYDELGLYTPASTGSAAPFGTYQMIYPVNPGYFDPRDTRLYGAQGAGVPITVPLAPNVGSAYNYGTGLPASRLTPISVPR